MVSTNCMSLQLDACRERFAIYNRLNPQRPAPELFQFERGGDVKTQLSQLARLALDVRYTVPYLYIYRPIFADVVSRWLCELGATEPVAVLDGLGRCIRLCPEIGSLAHNFLSERGDFFCALIQTHEHGRDNELQRTLLAYYRLIYYDREAFKSHIHPHVLHAVLESQQPSVVKFLAMKLLSLYLEMSESTYIALQNKHIAAGEHLLSDYEGDSGVDYRFLELNESKVFSNFSQLPDDTLEENMAAVTARNNHENTLNIPPESLSAHVIPVCNVLIAKVSAHEPVNVRNTTMVPTAHSVEAMVQLAQCVQHSKPVMLVGGTGSGKTFLVNELARMLGVHDSMVKIHLGEQTDAKLLLGTYTSGERPGTFEWRSGVLTTAIKEGRWVLIEDINKAPTEVLSVLLTLLEKRELSIPSRGQVIKAAAGFQLISTITLEDDSKSHMGGKMPDLIGISRWHHIKLSQPTDNELNAILCEKYPLLRNMIPKFITTYNAVQAVYGSPQFISLNKGVHPRVLSVRDLVKLCNRVQQIFVTNNITAHDQLIESSIYDYFFIEAVDCFASAVSEAAALQPLITRIGESLEVSAARIALYLTKHVPQFEDGDSIVRIGRAAVAKSKLSLKKKSLNSTSFARTNHALRLMEQICVAIQLAEPLLLVGETGTGKTSVVQQVAKMLNKSLTVINVSQQTESGDLLGGYKPVNCKTIAIPILEEFELLFAATFSMKKNEKFYQLLHKCFNNRHWKNFIRLLHEAVKMARVVLAKEDKDASEKQRKKRKLNDQEQKLLLEKWESLQDSIKSFEIQATSLENSFVFNFVEGSLVKAVRNGDWLLLDEVNLASADTLESIADLLSEKNSRSILLSEKGETEAIKAHPDFRIFACMNPATDVGKRDLPAGVRSRFSEIYVHSPDRDLTDLLSIIDRYIRRYGVSDEWVGNDVAQLYLEAKRLAESNKIVDGANQKPHFSIRTLTRTLLYVTDIVQIYGLRRSLYEGFCMSFLTLLDEKSESILLPLIEQYTIGKLKNPKSVISQTPPSPGPGYVKFKHYWMKCGAEQIQEQPHYIITPFVEKNMLNLVRATSGGKFPILVQGPTSAGKTSMIKYLADVTGHKFVRINNHEHTDLQEYLGTYVTDSTGKLIFREGILVEALRNGYWIVLDELNLAPSDVLEALNRLLDDNRELFIPETQEVIHPHPDFMLFATQNPPGIYGGRKVLSRAFRNRFLELHFDDIPQDELEIILRERCQIAPSYAKKIVEVYRQLLIQRSANRLFEQKNSFATLRDLFRWALREAVGYEQLGANGYMLLAERCRSQEEKNVVKSVIETVMRVQLDMDSYYESLENKALLELESSVVWTKAMRRLAVLVNTCLENNEPVLLVGETGCGKTTICDLIARYQNKKLITMNAHQNTETGDILGAQRPMRNRSELQQKLLQLLLSILPSFGDEQEPELSMLIEQFNAIDKSTLPAETVASIQKHIDMLNVLFEWTDGPLIQAMNSGDFFLLDEISLADDSVLERLNSVLEPERSLLLAEKGSSDCFIVASKGFQFLATMNPGGDYGKKELSPALRNRLTEIWVPSMESFEDVRLIVSTKLQAELSPLVDPIVKFSEWYGKKFGAGKVNSGVISLRDILAWVEFINSTSQSLPCPFASLIHGAAMVFIDALGTNNTAYLAENEERLELQKQECINYLSELAGQDLRKYMSGPFDVKIDNDSLKSGLFTLPRTLSSSAEPVFNLGAPTTAYNLMKVVRAMQVQKPILLEGSPGVGKTTLISALADCTGNELTRINLSEQTDLIDLFGSDAPGEKTGEFVWRDAPFLRAMQKGEWVLLDEMNLASQSVLEGLNACLDHRGEAYIPELNKSFTRHPNFRVFAAQNPQYQGGGRKGLPKSFINRFSVVYVDMLKADDLLLIASYLYPQVPPEISEKMIKLMSQLEYEVSVKKSWGSLGAPWEFNLRDTLRWLKLLNSQSICNDIGAVDFLDIIVKQRFRTESDRQHVNLLIQDIFGSYKKRDNYYQVAQDYLQVNAEIVQRKPLVQFDSKKLLVPLQTNYEVYESLIRCINHNWPVILVGPTNAGKTGIIHHIGSLVGANIVEFSMNSDVDSMDILGGYEQVDITRKIGYVISKLTSALRELLILNITTNNNADTDSDAGVRQALILFEFIKETAITPDTFDEFLNRFTTFIGYTDKNSVLQEIQQDIHKLTTLLEQHASVKFEWFDGLLIKAVEEGHWLILDNANLCSPSVLDRLNSLLEPNGTLIVNECSLADGRPRHIRPHPNFRLFMTVDPKYGELSRAMRNRGIEIFIEDLRKRATEFDQLVLGMGDLPQDDSGLEEQLQNITLSERSSRVPISAYLSPRLSYLLPFAKLHDIIFMAGDDISASVLSVLPLISSEFISHWKENVIASSLFEDKEVVARLDDLYHLLDSSNVLPKIKDIYAYATADILPSVNSNSFAVHQPFHPLLNAFIAARLQNASPNILSQDVHYFYQLVEMELQGNESLTQVERNALHGKLNQLTYLEQSAAVYQGRHIKNPPRVEVYTFLMQLRDFVHHVIINCGFCEYDGGYKLLHTLYVIWRGIFEAAIANDEARLRVYQDLLLEWVKAATDIIPELGSVSELIQQFCEGLNLTSGLSMTLLWGAFRKSYPSSLDSWDKLEKVEDMAEKFDLAVTQQLCDSYPLIRQLQDVFHGLVRDVLSGTCEEFEQVISKIESGLSELNRLSSLFLIKRRHFFLEEFDKIARFLFLNPSDCSTVLFNIAPTSSISTSQLVKANSANYAFPASFDFLWMREGLAYKSHVDDIFTASLLKGLIPKLNSFTNFTGSHITQTVNDATLLLHSMVDASAVILQDQYARYKQVLIDWYKATVKVHLTCESDETDCRVLADLVIANTEPYFSSIHEKFFLPALQMLDIPGDAALGKSYVLFAIGMIQLYVPSSPYDPAVHDYVILDHFSLQKNLSETLAASWKAINKVIIGEEPSNISESLPLITDSDKPASPSYFRPKTSINPMFDEWSAFMTSTVDAEPLEKLLHLLEDSSSSLKVSSDQVKMFQQNTSHFLDRLSTTYKHYSDLNDIFSGYVYCLKFGYDLLLASKQQQQGKLAVSPLWAFDINILTDVSSMTRNITSMGVYFKEKTVDSLDAERVLLHYLALAKYHGLEGEVLYNVNTVLQTLYYRWSLRRIKNEKLAREQNSIFRYKDDSEDAEQDFKKLFPDYEDVLSINADDKTVSSQDDLLEVYYRLAVNYMSLFGETKQLKIQELIHDGAHVIGALLHDEKFETAKMTSHSYVAVINELASVINSINSPVVASDIDFYHGGSVVELKKSARLIERLLYSVNNLLVQWPEHSTLRELFRICKEYLEYSADTPIAKLLQKIEQIYTFAAEWEKYASKNVSLNVHIDELTRLIVEWRKLELVAWKSLFEYEIKSVERNIGNWWFHLYETVINANFKNNEYHGTDEEYTQLLLALNVFFSKSTYGEIDIRLKMVHAFISHVSALNPAGTPVLHALTNITTFYEQFLPVIEDNIAANKKILEKEISEVILLASWKDVNVDALKQSSRRSHNSLYKILRKYRELLATEVSPLVQNGISASYKLTSQFKLVALPMVKDISSCELKVQITELPSWATGPKVLLNLARVEKNMTVYISRITGRTLPDLYSYAQQVMTEAERLRSETPKVYSKDKKKLLATLKTQKRKALSDTLKELRRMGLKTHFRDDIHKLLGSVTSILANTKSLKHTAASSCDNYYFRILDIIPRVRSTVSSPADDVPLPDLEAGLAIFEDLMSKLILARDPLHGVAVAYDEFGGLRQYLEEIITSKELMGPSIASDYQLFSYYVKWLPYVIEYALDTLRLYSTAAAESTDTSFFQQAYDEVRTFEEFTGKNIVLNERVSNAMSAFNSFLLKFVEGLQANKNTKCQFVYDMVDSWVRQSTAPLAAKFESTDAVSKIDETVRRLCTSIILSIQRLMESQTDELTEEHDKWFALSNKQIVGNMKLCNAEKIISTMRTLVNHLKQNDFIGEEMTLVSSTILYAMPVFNQYHRLLGSILNVSQENYYGTSRATYLFSHLLYNLAKDGFCSPEPPSEEVEDNNLHEGTGLGDGEGAQNNSKDVEEDEDLLEDAQRPNDDQKDKDERSDDEDDNAVDMEGDIAGDLEDAPGQDSGDEDDKDEEEKDLDEEIDDLDDDPNAIDDKMWNEEPEEDTKEKESDKMPENSATDDVQASKEENDDVKDNNQADGNAEDGNEEEGDEEDGEEEDVGEQDDEVKHEDNQDLEANVPEVETMDLPEDMNLDSGDEKDSEDGGDDEFDDNMSVDEEPNVEEIENKADAMDEDNAGSDDDALSLEGDQQEDGVDEDGDDASDADADAEGPEEEGQANQSEEELADDHADENKLEPTDMEAAADQQQGLEGIEDLADVQDIDMEAAIEQHAGASGEGADAADSNEQENVGSSGMAQSHEQQQDNGEEVQDSSREEAIESLKQLGDSLKEFHRRHQQIKEASNNEEEANADTANTRPDEFEHINGAATDADTQALDTATKDQLDTVDKDQAIEDDHDMDVDRNELDTEVDGMDNDAAEADTDAQLQSGDVDTEEANGKSVGGFIGERDMQDDSMQALDLDLPLQQQDELEQIIEQIDLESRKDQEEALPPRTIEDSRQLWKKSEQATDELVTVLSEQLRLILEPTLATKLRGDYKTGKRLNMKRIIPYIASQFRKDKIWLRRTKPSKRQYQIMIAVDDSKSMSESKSVDLAFQSICLVSKALTQLESGGLSIVKFGETTKELHHFDQQFAADAGAKVFQWFGFQETKTDVKRLVAESIKIFERARTSQNSDLWQLQIVISDGVCEDHETVQRLVRRARENRIMLVFVIIDGINAKESILDMGQVSYVPDQNGIPQLQVTKYLDTFPFEFYVVVRDISELPEMISIILRQYFTELASL
ncbi:AaceriAGR074Cp [[Ashbya] aceris (nom. inval.)]|nr:AaceriAGR074Cp [[Ashbya] aceris (nom. inval.)]